MMEFSVSGVLGYRVAAPTPFVFNIQASRFPGQNIASETLTLPPGLKTETWVMPESGNRYLRLIAPPGELSQFVSKLWSAPGAQQFAREYQLADMVRIVVGHQQSLAKDGLTVPMRDFGKQVYRLVTD